MEEIKLWYGEDEELALWVWSSRKGIYYYIHCAGLVLDGVLIAKQFRKVIMLFRRLNDLCH